MEGQAARKQPVSDQRATESRHQEHQDQQPFSSCTECTLGFDAAPLCYEGDCNMTVTPMERQLQDDNITSGGSSHLPMSSM